MKNKNLEFWIPIIVFLLSSVLVFLGIIYGWFGEIRPGVMKFCEHARDGFIKQPANTISNLGFSFVGLLIAFQAFKGKFQENNKMNNISIYTILFSLALIITGAGSFAMHATNAHWGGFMDLLGMFLISSFMFAYALNRLFNLSMTVFISIYLTAVVLSSVVYLSPTLNFKAFLSGSEVCFVSFLLIGIAIELYLVFVRKIEIKASHGFFSLFTLCLSFLIWNLSLNEESILCDPHSLLQGHAVWHILDAVSGYFTFRYYASEKVG